MLRFVYFALIFICGKIVFCDQNFSNLAEYRVKEPGYLFTHPSTLLSGRNETVCLNLYDAALPTKVIVDLKIKNKHHTIIKHMSSDYSCFEYPVPDHRSQDVLQANFYIQIQLNGSIVSSQSANAVLIYPNNDVTFIETDRSLYKQGDLVRMRILVLTTDIKPSNQKVSEINLYNPKGFIVYKWRNVKLELGLVQLDYQLSEDASMGKWRLECSSVTAYFQVKRYALPRFNIELVHEKSVYSETKQVDITVCATYTFKKFVKATAIIKVTNLNPYNVSSRFSNLKMGCAKFQIPNSELQLSRNFSSKQIQRNLLISAIVTELSTNQVEMKTSTLNVRTVPYKLFFDQKYKHFQPGLPFEGKLKLVDKHVDARNDVVEICYQIAVKKSWNLKPEQCRVFRLKGDDEVRFSLWPFKDNVIRVILKARSLNYTLDDIADEVTLTKWYSINNNYIHIDKNTNETETCRSAQQYTIIFTTNKLKQNETINFYYMVQTRNQIVQMKKIVHNVHRNLIRFDLDDAIGKENKFVRAENYVDRFILKFKLHKQILSNSKLVVFYVSKEEVVTGKIDIDVEQCLPNSVLYKWSKPVLYPGEEVVLNINTSANSLCGISVVDKSSTLLVNIKRFQVADVLQPFTAAREAKPSIKLPCLSGNKKYPEALISDHLEDLRRRRRRKRSMLQTYNGFDSFDIFDGIGLSIITNKRVIAKPCRTEEENPFDGFLDQPSHLLTNSYDISHEDKGETIRSYFPGTWLWELIPVGATGKGNLKTNLPHSITTWMTNVFCVSSSGIGLGNPLELTAFQPFFLEIIMPTSVRRYEVMHLKISVFNYMNHSLPISINLHDLGGLEILDRPTLKKESFCLKSNNNHVATYRVNAQRVGKMNISVFAEIDPSYPANCGPETIINKRDVVYKTIVVESEGYKTEFAKSSMICKSDDSRNTTWLVDIPDDRILGSTSARLMLHSDLLGPTIQNLEIFLTVPFGCGEQIMSVMAPNLHVLNYLKSTGKLTQSTSQRAMKNLKIGYQRILDYVHKDGSFSAFGYHDQAGSMFLTAFVVRTLQKAKEFIYVDNKVIVRAIGWILSNQLENGCFSAVSHVFQDMGGTSNENSTAALTAYVVISLLEANLTLPDNVRTNVLYCVRGQQNADKYTLAIISYALYLLNWSSEANRYLVKLLNNSSARTKKTMWWGNQSGSLSENIEMAGYILMSLLYNSNNDNLKEAGAIVRWLGTHRGIKGGFVTSQDSSVALDALSRYCTIVNNLSANATLRISTPAETFTQTFNGSDEATSAEIQFRYEPSEVKIQIDGDGCVLAQLSVTYNVNQMQNAEAFSLNAEASPVSTIDPCSIIVVSTCISYLGFGHANMAVLEAKVPSGYHPERLSLFQLVDNLESRAKKFEDFSDKVVIYFTELDAESVCTSFRINKFADVEERLNTTVKLYDYYKPELQTFAEYRINECVYNEISTLPEVVTDNTDDMIGKNRIKKETDFNIFSGFGKQSKVRTGLNPNFTNVDHDMATPSGIEGNVPVYVNISSG